MNRFRKLIFTVGALLLIGGSGTAFAVHYLNDSSRDTPLVFSNNALLLETWNNYKQDAIEPGSNRTLDKSQNNITTSEGESYTMLRAVWMDDKTTFDKSWLFTKNNLQRPDDHLMSWKFGKKADGKYGILTDIGGQNTASDADGDIALSLMMAYSRWNETAYLYQAKQIMASIWEKEVISVQGKPVLAANDIERNSATTIIVNPSYFAPYSYKLFAKVDFQHNWNALADNSYSLLSDISQANLDTATSSGLPPNWIQMNRKTGTFTAASAPNLDTNYGYDAIRTPWRLALDYQWFKDPRDKQVLTQFSFLGKQLETTNALQTVYAHDGKVVGNYESPAMYGTAMGYFSTIDPTAADTLYKQKLQTLYSPDKQQWKTPLSYYDDNWAWFGIALYQHALPNLATINN